MKMVAPSNMVEFVADGQSYKPDSEGMFTIDNHVHVAAAKQHGMKPYDPVLGVDQSLAPATAAPVGSAAEEALALKDQQIADMQSKMDAMQATIDAAVAPVGPDAPAPGADASGDTSTGTEGIVSEADLEAMGRDELVTWLGANGVHIPKNSSGTEALTVAKETLAEMSGN